MAFHKAGNLSNEQIPTAQAVVKDSGIKRGPCQTPKPYTGTGWLHPRAGAFGSTRSVSGTEKTHYLQRKGEKRGTLGPRVVEASGEAAVGCRERMLSGVRVPHMSHDGGLCKCRCLFLGAKWAKELEQNKDRALSYSLVMRPQTQVLNCETGGLSLRVSSGSCQLPHPAFYDYPNIPAPLLSEALPLLVLAQSQGTHYRCHRLSLPQCGSNNTRGIRNLSCI